MNGDYPLRKKNPQKIQRSGLRYGVAAIMICIHFHPYTDTSRSA